MIGATDTRPQHRKSRVLLMEGNPDAVRAPIAAAGLRSGSELYSQALRAISPGLHIDVIHAADSSGALPTGTQLADYHGVVVGGSALHAYSRTAEVERQIVLLRAAADMGLPILGSCWGLQITAHAAGGVVRRSPVGREVGVARKIRLSPSGSSHSLFSGKPGCFDALCIHYDEVAQLPPGGTILAANHHSAIQAAEFRFRKSVVWGLQYHPEFDFAHVGGLMRFYREDMLGQGFCVTEQDLLQHAGCWEALAGNPDSLAAAWKLGVDQDVTNPALRRSEIANWLGDHPSQRTDRWAVR